MKPTLGLYMIVRDAQETLVDLLQSVQGAFDEYVFVDTGSKDETKDILRSFVMAMQNLGNRAVVCDFEWVKDFSAARQFAYEQGRADWRMYLDADDVLPKAGNLRPTIAAIAARNPQVNAISLPYAYSPGVRQDVPFRIVRWADGWKWFGRLHEELRRDPPGPRVISKIDDLVVEHCKPDSANLPSVARNLEILQLEAEETKDPARKAVLAYNLGEAARILGQTKEATSYLSEAVGSEHIAPNIGAVAAARLCQLELSQKKYDDALCAAALGLARWPEHPEPRIALGLTHFTRGDFARAAQVWDDLAALPVQPLVSLSDDLFLLGLRGCTAARTYVKLGRVDDAIRELNRVGQLANHAAIRPEYTKANRAVMEAEGWRRLHALWEFFVWSDEPLAALRLLDNAPTIIAESPAVAKLARLTRQRLRHLDSWESYKACYAALPAASYAPGPEQRSYIRSLGRAKATRAWAESLPKTGPTVRLLSVGCQDGNIEGDVLEACPRIQLTVADASTQADSSIRDLMARFPGRVTHYAMSTDVLDWPAQLFDAIFLFEVVEHLPDDVQGLLELRSRLAEGGVLFLSTPVGAHWVNTNLADNPTYDWYGHVRCYSPESLLRAFDAAYLQGTVHATDDGTIFLAQLRSANPWANLATPSISIYVPGTPHPFDGESHLAGHLGGSEEAVIYLAEALARRGHPVTVYAPRPERPDGKILHGKGGVLWRDVADFDVEGENGVVLYWRCPQALLATPPGRGKRILWLHDTHYEAPAEAYAKADGVIVLSKAHAAAVTAGDGFAGPFTFAKNGIDLQLFPELREDEPRNPLRVVYGSSPDRGLAELLDLWPLVRNLVPDATLDIFYTWELLEAAMAKNPELRVQFGGLKSKALGMTKLGVNVRGGVDHATLAREYRTAGVWAYPTHFYEISCITAMKAMAAGLEPIAYGVGALPETLGAAGETTITPGADDRFVSALVNALLSPRSFTDRKALSDRARMAFGWDAVAEKFAAIFEDVCRPPQPSEPSSRSASAPMEPGSSSPTAR